MAQAERYTIPAAGKWGQEFQKLANRLDGEKVEWYARRAESNFRKSVLVGLYGLLLFGFGLSFKLLLNWAVSRGLAQPLRSGELGVYVAAAPWVVIGLYVFCQAVRYLMESRAQIRQGKAMMTVQ
jgi:hypothetical protein